MALLALLSHDAIAQSSSGRAAIHPVATTQAMQSWLRRVPPTRMFPNTLHQELSAQSGVFAIEVSSAPGCVPCADVWSKLGHFRARYRWPVRVIGQQEAMLRSGRLGLPWVGHPIVWVRPINDPRRAVPVAVGTDHYPNLLRNIYLAGKMHTGVRPAVAVRMMSRFTGIVGAPSRTAPSRTAAARRPARSN